MVGSLLAICLSGHLRFELTCVSCLFKLLGGAAYPGLGRALGASLGAFPEFPLGEILYLGASKGQMCLTG